MLTFDRIARGYGVADLIDYYANAADPNAYERGNGLLVASGSGSMMGIMDMCPEFRWCFDIDANKGARLGGLLSWASRFCRPIGIAGWFSITNPDTLQAAIEEALEQTPEFTAVVYAAPGITLSPRLPHANSLADFERMVGALADAAIEAKA
jgi:hypothetical protein